MAARCHRSIGIPSITLSTNVVPLKSTQSGTKASFSHHADRGHSHIPCGSLSALIDTRCVSPGVPSRLKYTRSTLHTSLSASQRCLPDALSKSTGRSFANR